MAQEKTYYHLMDGFRGFALVHMVFFHFFYDYFVIFGHNPHWYSIPAVRVWQSFICMSFILISGISTHFSRSNYKRGLLLNLYGLMITGITALFLPSELVLFGILNFLGCSILLLALVRRPLQGISPAMGLSVSLLLFLLTYSIPRGYMGLGSHRIALPTILYASPCGAGLGFPPATFYSSDYFPMLPWFFLFAAGYFLWPVLSGYEHRRISLQKRELLTCKLPFLSYIGRKSIWIYLIHQPLLYLIAFVVSSGLPG